MTMMTKKDKKFYFVVAGTVLIMYGFGFLPTFGQVSPEGMKILGIFLGCIFAWCFGELVWSSLLGLASLAIFGFGNMGANYASAYANNTIATMITAIVFCYAVEQCGLLRELSKWIVGQKWAQKSPWGLVLAFYIAAVLGGAMATNAIAPVILLWALFYEMAKEIGVKPYDAFSVIVLCGIGVASFVGVAMMPYAAMTVLVRGAAENFDPSFVFNVGQYMVINLFVAIIFTPLVVLVLRLVAGSKVKVVMPQREPYRMTMTAGMKICLGLLVFLIVSMVVPNFLPDGNVIRELFNNKLTVVGTFMILSVILMVIHIDEKPILDITEGIRYMPWPLILLVSSALAISGFITADGMGIVPTIVSWLDPLVAGKSALGITLMFVAIGLIMTNFLNDVVTCVVLYPIGAQFIIDAGGSIMLFAILFGQVTIQGCLMPSGSFMGAMFHGNADWMRPKDIFYYVAIMEIVLLFVLLIAALLGGFLGY